MRVSATPGCDAKPSTIFRKTGSIRCSDVTAAAKESSDSTASPAATNHLTKGSVTRKLGEQRVFVVAGGFRGQTRQHPWQEVIENARYRKTASLGTARAIRRESNGKEDRTLVPSWSPRSLEGPTLL